MYQYRHFIPENTAPIGTKRIGVYDSNGKQVCTIPLGGLTPPAKEKLYSFGLVSDIHIHYLSVEHTPDTKFDNALTYFENYGCAFCVACGDLVTTGFYQRTDESDASTTFFDDTQFTKYKEICEKHTIAVYELCGNHESYYSMPISNNLDLLEAYTGKGELSYTITQGNDLFVLCGQPKDVAVMSDEDFTWLCETLADNTDKRCFIFVHAYIEEDSGDPLDVRENSIFDYWGSSKTTAFKQLLKQYENVVLFHGHSHTKFECQELDEAANYTEKNGFKSAHIPSLGVPRGVDTEKLVSTNDHYASQGYIVDVYDDCIVLNGMDFIGNKPIPLGVYKIDI